ncbi:hypothetical protein DPMN_110898 [Dreissena polymorpha]|uniref:Repulsive guidance molecule A n=2 Tax=Dreissena polymorpha TaxID=45954 RepID=A0A9D4KDU0_DREPO|nr:hypothetical protein DPMN_110898 [Dreissena polymorpha]
MGKRHKTRFKLPCSDNLDESNQRTPEFYACHGKPAMFSRESRRCQPSALLLVGILLALVNTVLSCDVDSCWDRYQVAADSIQKGRTDLKSSDQKECILFRTYMNCLENLQGCKGNIKFHSVKKVVRNQMNQMQCSTTGEVVSVQPEIIPLDEVCTYHTENDQNTQKHCGLFGDPHLRTFFGEFQTCRVQGAWPLVDNEHLTVQVTNEPVAFNATATTKLTVIIRGNEVCAASKYMMYQAEGDVLPSTFEDGQTMYGEFNSVRLTEIDPGKHVEIFVKYINTTIQIRLVGSYLTFSISMPGKLVNESAKSSVLELCTKGCPKGEVIDYQKVLASKMKGIPKSAVNLTADEALRQCRSANLVDFYLDSCVFDLLMTGNDSFKLAAYAAFQDILKSDAEFRRTQKNRTTIDLYRYNDSSGTVIAGCSSLVLVLMLTVLSLIAGQCLVGAR